MLFYESEVFVDLRKTIYALFSLHVCLSSYVTLIFFFLNWYVRIPTAKTTYNNNNNWAKSTMQN